MKCKYCSEEVGLVHRCKPVLASPVGFDPYEVARTICMMNDAGYPFEPVELILAQGLMKAEREIQALRNLP